MKAILSLPFALLLAACTPDQPDTAAPAPAAAPSPSSVAAGPVRSASATGTVEAVDPQAQVITIAHGPVESLDWPSMTMPFEAPGIELGELRRGDRVEFDFTAQGTSFTITRLERR